MREGAANGTKTAREANGDGVALGAHTHSEGDRRALPQGGSLRSGLESSPPKPRRSSSGRLRTASGKPARGGPAATATLETATRENSDNSANGDAASAGGATASGTARKGERGREARTGWELRELIRPLPVRRKSASTRHKLHYFDPALIEWVYGSRFAITSQLQRRFPERLPSLRTAQRHVRRLVQMGLLAPAPVRSTGPHFPMVVYATGKGINVLRETYRKYGKDWDGPRTEDGKAQGLALDSILHEILITEFDLAVQRTIDGRDDLELLSRERRYFRRDRRLTYDRQGRTHRLVPDAGYLTAVCSDSNRDLLPLMLLEMENGTHSMRKLRRKLQAYRRWADGNAADWLSQLYGDHGDPQKRSFRLLLVAHDKHGTVTDERRLLDLLIPTLELPAGLRDSVWLATADDLLADRRSSTETLERPVWLRAKECRTLLPEYRSIPPGRGQRQYLRRRQFLSERIPSLPRRGLFPQPE
ncbi:MAG: hypothetical protein DWQ34_12900 [Planctomycetota bacterium]|nr:MAG: hypothetical protein DWQ34_12900 [Planctomycetota bacterium]REJ95699.1 MAG: hypothetical protein DWQ29_01660 [Planctomycetota bacterium]REK22927.1 MAG: hypothetical protein DWQ41_18130 [Planctomycetota bacterium]REK27785.1 MAG: hypothetical protein DWQ45_25315 [Planctomycetota bacterium]